MSVVNKMLQDLEARESEAPRIFADYQPPAKSKTLAWLLVLIPAALLIGLGFWFSQDAGDTIPALDSAQSVLNQAQESLHTETTPIPRPMEKSENPSLAEPVLPPIRDQQGSNQPLQSDVFSGDRRSSVIPSGPENTAAPAELRPAIAALGEEKKASERKTENAPEQESQQGAVFSISDSKEAAKSAGAKQGILNALSDGNEHLAIVRLQQLLDREPQNIGALKKLASLLFAQGRNQQARQLLQQGLDKFPGRSDVRLMLARLYVHQTNHQQALSLLAGFQPSLETQREYWTYRGALAQQLGNYTLAKDDYLQLTQVDPGQARGWLGLAIAFDRLGQKAKALEAYEQANTKDPLSPAVVTFIRQRIAILGAPL